MNIGFLKLQRKFFDHWLWKDERRSYSKSEAFLDLLQMAAFGEITRMVSGCPVALMPGQLVASERFLAERWSWSTTKIRTFLQTLVSQGMIVIEKKQPASVITLCNYAKYAHEESGEKAEKKRRKSGEKAEEKQIKEREELKEGEDKEILPFQSEEFAASWREWKEFRRSKKKPLSQLAISKCFKTMSQFSESSCIEAIDRSIANDYLGIFPQESKKQQTKHAGIQEDIPL